MSTILGAINCVNSPSEMPHAQLEVSPLLCPQRRSQVASNLLRPKRQDGIKVITVGLSVFLSKEGKRRQTGPKR